MDQAALEANGRFGRIADYVSYEGYVKGLPSHVRTQIGGLCVDLYWFMNALSREKRDTLCLS